MQSVLLDARPVNAVSYVPVFLQPLLEETESRAEFLRELSLVAQGEAAMLMDDGAELAPTLVAFARLRALCPEVALHTQAGNEVLIFSDQLREPIRSADIVTDLVDQSPEREPAVQPSIDLTLDLSAVYPAPLWKQEELSATAEALAPLRQDPPTAQRITLLGNAPLLFLLFLVDLLAGRCEELWLQKTPDTNSALIYSSK